MGESSIAGFRGAVERPGRAQRKAHKQGNRLVYPQGFRHLWRLFERRSHTCRKMRLLWKARFQRSPYKPSWPRPPFSLSRSDCQGPDFAERARNILQKGTIIGHRQAPHGVKSTVCRQRRFHGDGVPESTQNQSSPHFPQGALQACRRLRNAGAEKVLGRPWVWPGRSGCGEERRRREAVVADRAAVGAMGRQSLQGVCVGVCAWGCVRGRDRAGARISR